MKLKIIALAALMLATAATATTTATTATASNYTKAGRYAHRLEKQIDSDADGSVRMLGSHVIDVLLRKGARRLELAGYNDEAASIIEEWQDTEQFKLYDSLRLRHIGDHAPLSLWLQGVTEKMRLLLGVAIWKSTHLSDIETLNNGLPVVLRPCSFDMDAVTISRAEEYQDHFAKDILPADGGDELYGVVPVLTYWTVEIPCIIGTSGLGGLVCSPLSAIAESIMGKRLAPKLSNRVFNRACGPLRTDSLM